MAEESQCLIKFVGRGGLQKLDHVGLLNAKLRFWSLFLQQRQALASSEERRSMVRFRFDKDHSGCCMENGSERQGWLWGGGGPVRRLWWARDEK